jgi:hypothetical protein
VYRKDYNTAIDACKVFIKPEMQQKKMPIGMFIVELKRITHKQNNPNLNIEINSLISKL